MFHHRCPGTRTRRPPVRVLPSPFIAPTALTGPVAGGCTIVCCVKVPSPLPSKTPRLPVVASPPKAKSRIPSPLKSPVATPLPTLIVDGCGNGERCHRLCQGKLRMDCPPLNRGFRHHKNLRLRLCQGYRYRASRSQYRGRKSHCQCPVERRENLCQTLRR